MADYYRPRRHNNGLPTEMYSPVPEFNQATYKLDHTNTGDYRPPKSNTEIVANYPHRTNRHIVYSRLPRLWPEFVNPNNVRSYVYNVPTGLVLNGNTPGKPISSEAYTLPKRMYLYNGRMVVE